MGNRFSQLYAKYEKEGRGRKTIKAKALWYKIIEAQIEFGVPYYMLYKVSRTLYHGCQRVTRRWKIAKKA